MCLLCYMYQLRICIDVMKNDILYLFFMFLLNKLFVVDKVSKMIFEIYKLILVVHETYVPRHTHSPRERAREIAYQIKKKQRGEQH